MDHSIFVFCISDVSNLEHHWENIAFSSVGENWLFTCKRMIQDPYFMPYIKINSKCINDLNVRPEIIKLLEEAT